MITISITLTRRYYNAISYVHVKQAPGTVAIVWTSKAWLRMVRLIRKSSITFLFSVILNHVRFLSLFNDVF